MFGEDQDRELFFEAARRQAEEEFAADNTNAQALVRWGGALLELAHYKQGQESTDMIQAAIVKLKKALDIDPDRADADWCLGNAYTSLGFLCPTKRQAQEQFDKAADCFKKCQVKDPSNETYKKAIDMCDKAPEYYDEIQSHIQASAMGAEAAAKMSGGSPSSGGGNDFWWDLGGWAMLGAFVVGCLVVARVSAGSPAGAPSA